MNPNKNQMIRDLTRAKKTQDPSLSAHYITTLLSGEVALFCTRETCYSSFKSFKNPLSHLLKTFLIRFKFFNEILLKLKTEIP